MLNSFYVEVTTRLEPSQELFRIQHIYTLQGFNTTGFLQAIENGDAAIDFDARTHHNHGTKFRVREELLPNLYAYVNRVG